MAAKKDFYRVKDSVHIETGDGAYSFTKGELIRGSHSILTKDYMHLFEALDDVVRPEVEQATAAPAEKRAAAGKDEK
jgi:hypothetical protein